MVSEGRLSEKEQQPTVQDAEPYEHSKSGDGGGDGAEIEADAALAGAVEIEPDGTDADSGDPGSPDAASPDPFRDCPVTPLGVRGLTLCFLSAEGALVEIPANALKRNAIITLFSGDLAWLEAHYPIHYRDDNNEEIVIGWSLKWAFQSLVRACAARGVFDLAMPMRGPGVWRDPATDGLIVHCGDQVMIEGAWRRAGFVREGALYVAGAPLRKPAAEPAGPEVGLALLDDLGRWHFLGVAGPDLVLGFIGLALLGAAPPWRVHLKVTAEYGAGKSWLAEKVSMALGAQAQPGLTDYTIASLQQAFTGEARAIVLDEAENGEDGRVAEVIKLLRQLSGGAGARGARGSPTGAWRAFSVNGCAYLTSIVPVPLQAQDLSRIVHVRLGRLPQGVAAAGQADEVLARMRATAKASPALRARAIAGCPRFIEAFQRYRAAVFGIGGDAREADTYGALLAGRDLLLYDAPPDHDSIETTMARFKALIVAAARRDEDEGEGERCLCHLLSSPAPVLRGEHLIISELIMRAYEPGEVDAHRALGALGLKLRNEHDPAGRLLLIANRHQGLARIFRDTRWTGGAWAGALRYLEGASAWPRSERFAGIVMRATAVPAPHLPGPEGHATPSPLVEELPD